MSEHTPEFDAGSHAYDGPCVHCGHLPDEHGADGHCLRAGYYGNRYEAGTPIPPVECHACRVLACEVEGNTADPHTCEARRPASGRDLLAALQRSLNAAREARREGGESGE